MQGRSDAMQLSRDELIRAYRTMRTIREFEERVHTDFATGAIPGFVHLYAGEEASATGVIMHLRKSDHIASTHRGHGHCIAKGCDVDAMMAELYGKETGLCKGKGGSMHIADLDQGMMGANGIVGGGPPLVSRPPLESLTLAKIWNLAAIFVVENNGYAEATASKWAVATPNVADRAQGFGMPGVVVDGHDFFAVYEAAGEAVARARKGGGPSLIEVKVNRYFGHFEGDAQTYRGKDEVKKIRETKDCLMLFRRRVTEAKLLDGAALDRIDREAAAAIDNAVKKAVAAPKPRPEELLTDVYVSY